MREFYEFMMGLLVLPMTLGETSYARLSVSAFMVVSEFDRLSVGSVALLV